MYEYYFKIKKGDIEFECSTTDKITFEQQLSDWINGIVKGEPLPAPIENSESQKAEPIDFTSNNQERSGFIDVKKLVSINDKQTPDFDFGTVQTAIIDEGLNFETTLNESIINPKTEVIEKNDEPQKTDFEIYFSKYSPESPMDRLIVSAMYVLNEENQERFTLKQINSKLVPLCGSPVDHSVIQDAIEQNYVRIIPDLTETSEFTEYDLTDEGEGYFVV